MTDLTLLLNILLFILRTCYFQICWSLRKAVQALNSLYVHVCLILLHCYCWLCFYDNSSTFQLNGAWWLLDMGFYGLPPATLTFNPLFLAKWIQYDMYVFACICLWVVDIFTKSSAQSISAYFFSMVNCIRFLAHVVFLCIQSITTCI